MTVLTGAEPVRRAEQAPNQPHEYRGEATNLDCRYGEIGISAVAAALRFAGASKNPAYAPVVPRIDTRNFETAA